MWTLKNMYYKFCLIDLNWFYYIKFLKLLLNGNHFLTEEVSVPAGTLKRNRIAEESSPMVVNAVQPDSSGPHLTPRSSLFLFLFLAFSARSFSLLSTDYQLGGGNGQLLWRRRRDGDWWRRFSSSWRPQWRRWLLPNLQRPPRSLFSDRGSSSTLDFVLHFAIVCLGSCLFVYVFNAGRFFERLFAIIFKCDWTLLNQKSMIQVLEFRKREEDIRLNFSRGTHGHLSY